MKFGAIDIGTNAARLLIGEILTNDKGAQFIKKISYTRIPLRLGVDVFDKGKIKAKKQIEFTKTIKAFKLISELFEVTSLRACATSAMREAENGIEIQKHILKETGVTIEIIDGEEEANLIFSTFFLLDFEYSKLGIIGSSFHCEIIKLLFNDRSLSIVERSIFFVWPKNIKSGL